MTKRNRQTPSQVAVETILEHGYLVLDGPPSPVLLGDLLDALEDHRPTSGHIRPIADDSAPPAP